MNDVGLGDLVVRMLVSLAIVLVIVLGAYAVLKRRQEGGVVVGGGARRGGIAGLLRPGGRGAARGAGGRRGLKVVGRVGVGRTSTVVAVQLADRVLVLGTSEAAAPTLLTELDLDTWSAANETAEELLPRGAEPGAVPGTPGRPRPGLLDALREATTRRG